MASSYRLGGNPSNKAYHFLIIYHNFYIYFFTLIDINHVLLFFIILNVLKDLIVNSSYSKSSFTLVNSYLYHTLKLEHTKPKFSHGRFE